ncbi:hypothetical protein HLH17_06900 [Acinetobacter sp. ANC 5380]|uniref:Uncharacterized protein n=2 Tax=Acinetobacter terrae TaxID=2731247 RepID=A0A7Y2REN2_9GAMM|nr:hypothetical protein [Acinetobacter terrae]
MMNKRQYKYSMTYPVSQTKSVAKAMSQALSGSNSAVGQDVSSAGGIDLASVETGNKKQCCQPLGRTTMIWGTGRYYPIKGEDMSFQIYRKRDCCQKVYGFGD